MMFAESMPHHSQPTPHFHKQEERPHRDSLGRSFLGHKLWEQTLDVVDCRLTDLVAQCLHFLDRPSSATWKRGGVKNGSLILIRVTEWAYGQSRIGNVLHRSKTKKVLRWLPACIALMILVCRKIDYMLRTLI